MIIDDRTALVTRAHRGIGQDEPYAGPLGAPVRPRGRAAATAAALAMMFGIAGAAWVIAVWQMSGMDMGVATRLGSFAFFVALWVSMMAAMMLPGAAPAVLPRAHASGRVRVVPVHRVLPCRLNARGCRRVCVVPAARVVRRRCGCHRGGCLRVHADQGVLPPALPREGPVWIRVRAVLRRLEDRPGGDAGGAGRHELRLDVRDRCGRPGPEGPAREGCHRCAAGAGDRRTWGPDRRRALVGSRSHTPDVRRHRRRGPHQVS